MRSRSSVIRTLVITITLSAILLWARPLAETSTVRAQWSTVPNSVELMTANFNDKAIDAPIGTGGAAVGEPVSVHPAITAIVRSSPLPTPSLEIQDNSSTAGNSANFEFLGSQELTTNVVLIAADLWFSEFEEYSVLVREQGGASRNFMSMSMNSNGDVFYNDGNTVFAIIGSYELNRRYPIRMAFDMGASTYDVWLDGALVLRDETHGVTDRGIGSVQFGVNFDPDTDGRFYVDNISVRTAAPCGVPCGDWTNDGVLGTPDVIGLVNFLSSGGTPAPVPDCADLDDAEAPSFRDLLTLIDCVFKGSCDSLCPPANPSLVGQANGDYFVGADDLIFPANVSSFTLNVELCAGINFESFWLPLSLQVDGQVPTFGTITVTPPAQTGAAVGGDAVIIFSDPNFPEEWTADRYPLASVELIMPPAGTDREISFSGMGFPGPDQPELMLDVDRLAWDPNIVTCIVLRTGDVNSESGSCVITSADIIYMVNFVFKGGPGPLPCVAAGDVNCDGQPTSADIIHLVNFVFKGGLPPCDVCTLVATGAWSCP